MTDMDTFMVAIFFFAISLGILYWFVNAKKRTDTFIQVTALIFGFVWFFLSYILFRFEFINLHTSVVLSLSALTPVGGLLVYELFISPKTNKEPESLDDRIKKMKEDSRK